MGEEVNTGGITSIKHEKGEKFELDKDREKGIEDAYVRAKERKRKERLFWVIGIIFLILVIGIGAFFIFR